MAPTRTVKSKHTKSPTTSKSASTSKTKSSSSSKPRPRAPIKQQKTKSTSLSSKPKKKKRIYTDKELGIQPLNMITPVGVQKPKGKKKGRVFIDDKESMMTILAMVNADKEGQIESKMMKARQMEEIREARKKEAEARQEQRREKFEETKDSIRKKRKRRADDLPDEPARAEQTATKGMSKKRVSFG